MPYLVDTDWLIDHLARAPAAEALLSALAAEGVAISIISYMEVYQGTLRSPDPAGRPTYRPSRALCRYFLSQLRLPNDAPGCESRSEHEAGGCGRAH